MPLILMNIIYCIHKECCVYKNIKISYIYNYAAFDKIFCAYHFTFRIGQRDKKLLLQVGSFFERDDLAEIYPGGYITFSSVCEKEVISTKILVMIAHFLSDVTEGKCVTHYFAGLYTHTNTYNTRF